MSPRACSVGDLHRSAGRYHESPATALQVPADALLGIAPLREDANSARYRLRKRLRKVEDLPPEDPKIVIKVVDALLESRGVKKAS